MSKATEDILDILIDNVELDPDYLRAATEAFLACLHAEEQSTNPLARSFRMTLLIGELPWLVKEMTRLRKATGLSQVDVAKAWRRGDDAVQRREAGRVKFTPRDVQRLVVIYGVEKDTVLCDRLLKAAAEGKKRKRKH
jgi:hypothetical protein